MSLLLNGAYPDDTATCPECGCKVGAEHWESWSHPGVRWSGYGSDGLMAGMIRGYGRDRRVDATCFSDLYEVRCPDCFTTFGWDNDSGEDFDHSPEPDTVTT